MLRPSSARPKTASAGISHVNRGSLLRGVSGPPPRYRFAVEITGASFAGLDADQSAQQVMGALTGNVVELTGSPLNHGRLGNEAALASEASRHRVRESMTTAEIIEQLSRHEGALPRRAIDEAVRRREEIAPELLNILEQASANLPELAGDDEAMAHIFAMYLLAQFRERRAYPLLVDFVSGDPELVDRAMGDVITEDLGRLLASVCHGDTSLICGLIEDPDRDEYVRSAALDALVVLVAQGVKTREEVVEYLRSLFDHKLEREDSFVWIALVEACCGLRAEGLMPQIEQAVADDLVAPFFISLQHVRRSFATRPADPVEELARKQRMTFIDDTAHELAQWSSYRDPAPPPAYTPRPAEMPARSATTQKVCRNAPCPCGSGRKYKRCCGRSG